MGGWWCYEGASVTMGNWVLLLWMMGTGVYMTPEALGALFLYPFCEICRWEEEMMGGAGREVWEGEFGAIYPSMLACLLALFIASGDLLRAA